MAGGLFGELSRRHHRTGWVALGLFVSVGLVLDALLAFEVNGYRGGAEGRRFIALGHAHGALLALVNLAFVQTLERVTEFAEATVASRCLLVATVFLPAGFILGGLFPFEGDPGVAIWLVPVGGIALLVACLLTARRALLE